jgi:uncharacterized protein YqfB (UPF0267 family)
MAAQPVSVAVSAAAVQIYNPAVVGTPNAFIANNGTQPVYLGGSAVTFATGFVLYPGQIIDLAKAPAAIWAVCAPGTTGTSTTFTNAVAAGAGTVNSAATSGFSAGQVLALGTGNAQETLAVSSVTNGTTVVFTTATRFAHASGETLALVNASLGTSVNVSTGTY